MKKFWFAFLLLCVGCGNPPVQEGSTVSEGSSRDGGVLAEKAQDSGVAVEPGGQEPVLPEPSEEKPSPSEPKSEPPQEPVQPPQEPASEPVQDAGSPQDVPPEKPAKPDNPPTGVDYSKAGPLATKDLTTVSFVVPSSTGCTGRFCTVKLFVSLPSGGQGSRKGPYPLAVISNGFLLGADQYASYGKRLASWGYVVIRWDTNGEDFLSALKHDALGKMIVEIVGWAAQQNQKAGSALNGLVDTSKVVLVGHSRGGKVSALAAQADSRVVAFFGIDPVNSNPPGQSGASALTGMGQMKAAVAVVGADKGATGFQACAPKADNYEKFFNAAKSPAWEILLIEAGHMQFLDRRALCLPCVACTNGKTQDALIREITQTAMVAWAEKYTRGANISSYLTGSWLQSWKQKGSLQSRNK